MTHHIASDGWSMGVLLRELATLYRAFARAGDRRCPTLPIQYADFAVWQRRRLTGAVLDGAARLLEPDARRRTRDHGAAHRPPPARDPVASAGPPRRPRRAGRGASGPWAAREGATLS